jgi:hypothetical protein
LRFLSRLAKADLGIVTLGGTLSHLSPYTFKQDGILRRVGNPPTGSSALPAGRLTIGRGFNNLPHARDPKIVAARKETKM